MKGRHCEPVNRLHFEYFFSGDDAKTHPALVCHDELTGSRLARLMERTGVTGNDNVIADIVEDDEYGDYVPDAFPERIRELHVETKHEPENLTDMNPQDWWRFPNRRHVEIMPSLVRVGCVRALRCWSVEAGSAGRRVQHDGLLGSRRCWSVMCWSCFWSRCVDWRVSGMATGAVVPTLLFSGVNGQRVPTGTPADRRGQSRSDEPDLCRDVGAPAAGRTQHDMVVCVRQQLRVAAAVQYVSTA